MTYIFKSMQNIRWCVQINEKWNGFDWDKSGIRKAMRLAKMLHERSNYGIQVKYQKILFLIYIISYWHHSKAQGHTFLFSIWGRRGFQPVGVSRAPGDKPGVCPTCCHQPGERGTATSRHWHTLTHFSLVWVLLQCIPSSCCPWMSTGMARSDSATSSLSPFLRGKITFAWNGLEGQSLAVMFHRVHNKPGSLVKKMKWTYCVWVTFGTMNNYFLSFTWHIPSIEE